MLSARYYAENKTGDLMAHATNDLNAVRMACGIGIVAATDAVLLGLATIGFMLALNVKLTALALIPMPIIALFTLRAGKMLHQRFERVQETFSDLTERVRESIAGIRVVKAYVQEDYEFQRLSDVGHEYIHARARRLATRACLRSVPAFETLPLAPRYWTPPWRARLP